MHVGLISLYHQIGGYSGGLPTFTDQLARALTKLGHRVTIITSPNPKEDGGLQVHNVKGERNLHVVTLPSLRFMDEQSKVSPKPWESRKEIENAVADELGKIQELPAIRRKGALEVVEALDAQRRSPEFSGALFAAKARGHLHMPIVLSVHTTKDLEGWSPMIGKHPWAGVVLISPEHQKMLGRWGVFETAEKPFFVQPPGIDLQRFSPEVEPNKRLLELANGRIIIAELGARLVFDKGPDVALATFDLTRHKTPSMLLLGQRPLDTPRDEGSRREDTMRDVLRAYAVRKGIRESHDFHFVTYAGEIASILRAVGVSGGFVCASSRNEALGLLPLEALACGTPVVASEVSGHVFTVGGKGIPLVPLKGDLSELGRAFAEAAYPVLHNAEYRQSLIERGLALVQEFGLEACATKRFGLYQEVATNRTIGPGYERSTGQLN